MSRVIYFVTEGVTDQIILEELVASWMGTEDFIPRQIQPPTSALLEGSESNLSDGWRGVVAWCEGRRPTGPAGRNEALRLADCLIIHVDADVARDPSFRTPAFSGEADPARPAADWVRKHIVHLLGGAQPKKAVLCVPAQDLETWLVCALHPEVADKSKPIESRSIPGSLLVQRKPHQLMRREGARLRKNTQNYEKAKKNVAEGWSNCTCGNPPRCAEAVRFEQETRAVLGI